MVTTASEDPETGVIKTISSVPLTTRIRRKLMVYVSLVFIETFTMTFLAEWGDRSQISTIILAAREVNLNSIVVFDLTFLNLSRMSSEWQSVLYVDTVFVLELLFWEEDLLLSWFLLEQVFERINNWSLL